MEKALLILLLGSLLTTLWPVQDRSILAQCRRWLALAIGPFIMALMLVLLSG